VVGDLMMGGACEVQGGTGNTSLQFLGAPHFRRWKWHHHWPAHSPPPPCLACTDARRAPWHQPW